MRKPRTTIPRFAADLAVRLLNFQKSPNGKKGIMLCIADSMVVDLYPGKMMRPIVGACAYSTAALIAMAFEWKRRQLRINMLCDYDEALDDSEMTNEQVDKKVREVFAEENLDPVLVARIMIADARLRNRQVRTHDVTAFINSIAA